MSRRSSLKLVGGLFLLLLASCGARSSALTDALAAADGIPGWTPTGEVQVFDAETLYDLVDGQAESFFAYAFEQVTVQTYENAEGMALRIEVWQMATPADAYGLFTTYRAGTPVNIGNEGDADPGRRLGFWQGRYNVHLFAFQPLADDTLLAFAEAVVGALPAGGQTPELVGRLPQEGLVERSAIFFHEELSIQDYVWLGGRNLLGLGPETAGVLARYEVGDGVAQLLLVQYPDAGAASAGLDALESGQVSGLAAAQVRGELLGAVFGAVDKAVADELLAVTLTEE